MKFLASFVLFCVLSANLLAAEAEATKPALVMSLVGTLCAYDAQGKIVARPGAHEFVRKAKERFRFVIYTFQDQNVAEDILKELFPDIAFDEIYDRFYIFNRLVGKDDGYRGRIVETRVYMKNLKRLNSLLDKEGKTPLDLSQAVLVDHYAESFRANVGRVIPCPPFKVEYMEKEKEIFRQLCGYFVEDGTYFDFLWRMLDLRFKQRTPEEEERLRGLTGMIDPDMSHYSERATKEWKMDPDRSLGCGWFFQSCLQAE